MGIDITLDIPEPTQTSYHDLCRTRNTLLHMGLSEGIHIKHAVFIICETVTIANAIKACSISTPRKDIVYWGKALESYGSIGMNVGFIRAKVNRLLDLKTNAAEVLERKKDMDAKAGEKIRDFDSIIEDMIVKIRGYELEIEKTREEKRKIEDGREGYRKEADKIKATLEEEAIAPW